MPLLSAVCSDFYVNQKLALKLDLPSARETVLNLFDRVRRELPDMDQFRRYDGELALESPEQDAAYNWLALNRTAIRSGWVNPNPVEEAYRLHRLILEVAPYFLSISPLDVDYVELVFGFDLEANSNRNAVVFDALFGSSPLTGLIDESRETLLDVQPLLGFGLNRTGTLQGFVEVKTRGRGPEAVIGRPGSEPISVYLTIRRQGPFETLKEFTDSFGTLAGHAERLAEDRVIPYVVVPIREALL